MYLLKFTSYLSGTKTEKEVSQTQFKIVTMQLNYKVSQARWEFFCCFYFNRKIINSRAVKMKKDGRIYISLKCTSKPKNYRKRHRLEHMQRHCSKVFTKT